MRMGENIEGERKNGGKNIFFKVLFGVKFYYSVEIIEQSHYTVGTDVLGRGEGRAGVKCRR